MPRKYSNAGLTEELYRRLVSEYNGLRVKYGREFNGRIRVVRNCDVREARKYSQKFCNVIHKRSRLSPNTIDRIARRYRNKEGLGRNKPTVKHYLYRAYMLGV